jgi:hypothetical protein
MPVTNNNKMMLDRPMWEQVSFLPTTGGIAGSSMTDDEVRYIYWLNVTSTAAANFWRYDTWYDTWQQLATPPTTTISVATIKYISTIGSQDSGNTNGSILSLQASGTVLYLYQYNIATNIWTVLNTTGVPATLLTDASLVFPEPSNNAHGIGYHSGVLRSIATSAAVAAGATTISVTALPEALAIGTRLRFGSFNISITTAATKGATTLICSALPQGLSLGTQLRLPSGGVVVLSAGAAANATTLTVYPIQFNINATTTIVFSNYVVLTAAAALSATSLTVAPTMASITSGTAAPYYGQIYLVGNNGTQMYRYNIGTAVWSTTSANAANPAFPAMPAAIGAGCAARWLPGIAKDKIYIVRGGTTTDIYIYDLVANTVSSLVFNPKTETIGLGSSIATRGVAGIKTSLLIHKEATGRVYEVRPELGRIEPKMTQWLYPYSTVVLGDRSCCLTSPEGVDFYYTIPHNTPALVRCALLD